MARWVSRQEALNDEDLSADRDFAAVEPNWSCLEMYRGIELLSAVDLSTQTQSMHVSTTSI